MFGMALRCIVARMAPRLTDIARELYSVPLPEFVSARNARAAGTSDPELAAQIRTLKKPSVAAWIVNVFAQERASQLEEALHLAGELREAQEDLDARALAQLGRDRRALTNRLAEAAAELAETRGERVTASTRGAVQQTIAAAFFDPAAAAAVASGRLLRELEPSGDYEGDPEPLVGGGPPEASEVAAAPRDEVKARRERREAERALRAAEQSRERAVRDAASADRSLRAATLRVKELDRRERELDAELVAVRRDATRARASLEEAQAEQESRARAVDDAEEAVAHARRGVEDRPAD